MSSSFKPEKPFEPEDFPEAERPFPIVEMFGYHRELSTSAARNAFNTRWCPFANNRCEKFRQYGYGYCSITHRTTWDDRYYTYAVCDHRLDGAPIWQAVLDYFGDKAEEGSVLVPEVVLTRPRQSFDFIALEREGDRFVGIETQAIDIRGGGVGPANASLLEGDPSSWRARFTAEALDKGRKDIVAYGVNTANIYKRLGLQVAEKAAMLRSWGSKLYVVTQQRPFNYLTRRINLEWSNDDWEITFLVFDYSRDISDSGQMKMDRTGTYRTRVASFAEALVNPTSTISAEEFLRRVREKAGLDP